MTPSEARAHLDSMRAEYLSQAANYREHAEQYRQAANTAEDRDLQRVQFEESSQFAALARENDRHAEAIKIVLEWYAVAARTLSQLTEML